MALPKLNESIKYTTKIPSSGKQVKFRPYLVKEEKVLMMALETEDKKVALDAIADTINACVDEDVNVYSLPVFDIEYLFTQIRSKSVGESSTVNISCSECKTPNAINIDLSKIKVAVPKTIKPIKLTDDMTLTLKYPVLAEVTDTMLENEQNNASQTQQIFDLIAICLDSLETEEEKISFADESKEEVMTFLESFSNKQFEEVRKFVEDLPQMKHDVKFECESCQHENEITLKGTNDFF
jgi:hypothetical protein